MASRETLSTQEKRWALLLRGIETGFYNGTCLLLDTEWLLHNDITLTECGRLSEEIGAAMRLKRLTVASLTIPTPRGEPR
jgi:hypothetical protein